MADDGPRAGGPPVNPHTNSDPNDVTLREYMMAQLHALDVRLSDTIGLLVKSDAERFITEHAHVAAQLEALRERGDDRMMRVVELAQQRSEASQQAVEKVEHANEKRFESVNEFRAQLREQAGGFTTRNEVDAKLSAIAERMSRSDHTTDDRIKVLENKNSNTDGRFWALGAGITFVVLIINIIFHFAGK